MNISYNSNQRNVHLRLDILVYSINIGKGGYRIYTCPIDKINHFEMQSKSSQPLMYLFF